MKKLASIVVPRLRERTTWLGFVALLGALGVGLSPEQAEAVAVAGVAVAGLVAALFPESGRF